MKENTTLKAGGKEGERDVEENISGACGDKERAPGYSEQSGNSSQDYF